MKENVILAILNQQENGNVVKHEFINKGLFLVYVKNLNWKIIRELGNSIVHICPSERNDDTIRVSFDIE